MKRFGQYVMLWVWLVLPFAIVECVSIASGCDRTAVCGAFTGITRAAGAAAAIVLGAVYLVARHERRSEA